MSRYTYDHPRPSVTVDCVIFGIDTTAPASRRQHVLLIQRSGEPFRGAWALPGGFLEVSDGGDQGETIEAAAARELEEETGLTDIPLVQLGAFGAPGRDPRGRVISIAYCAVVDMAKCSPRAGSDAAAVRWWASYADPPPLAFDHLEIIGKAVHFLGER